MPDHKNASRAALSRVLIFSGAVLLFCSLEAAAEEDHSYLPPWMREEASGKTDRTQPVIAATVQIANPEARDPSASSGDTATLKTKAVRFVSQIFSRIGL